MIKLIEEYRGVILLTLTIIVMMFFLDANVKQINERTSANEQIAEIYDK